MSLAKNRRVRVWFIDCFAGPWKQAREDLHDTSIHIGLGALAEARDEWRQRGAEVEIGGIFVEKDRKSYRALAKYVEGRKDDFDRLEALDGEFGSRLEDIKRLVQNDPAFVFVDPTGFKGVAMRFIRELVAPRMRDVLVNVMFNDINRWKDDPREFLKHHIGEFFDIEAAKLPSNLSEDDLLALYRERRDGVI